MSKFLGVSTSGFYSYIKRDESDQLKRKNEIDEITGINPENYAIMNACNIPMQKSAYDDKYITEYNSSIINDLRIIRENHLSTRRNKISNKIFK